MAKEVEVTYRGSTPAAGYPSDQLLVEDPDSGERKLFRLDTPQVVDEKFAKLAENEPHQKVDVKSVTAAKQKSSDDGESS